MTIQTEFKIRVDEAVKHLAAEIRNTAAHLAGATGVTPDNAWRILLTELRSLDNPLYIDGRCAMWKARCRLYDQDARVEEPLADSDPNMPLDGTGTTILLTLPEVIDWVAELASSYHKSPCIGLGSASCRSQVQSFRTQLSTRSKNYGTLRLRYSVTEQRSLLGSKTLNMIARVDIERVGAEAR